MESTLAWLAENFLNFTADEIDKDDRKHILAKWYYFRHITPRDPIIIRFRERDHGLLWNIHPGVSRTIGLMSRKEIPWVNAIIVTDSWDFQRVCSEIKNLDVFRGVWPYDKNLKFELNQETYFWSPENCEFCKLVNNKFYLSWTKNKLQRPWSLYLPHIDRKLTLPSKSKSPEVIVEIDLKKPLMSQLTKFFQLADEDWKKTQYR